ncbi:MAG: helix-turn-helix domain-containing protein [Chitinivibrionales bacterium]
MKEKDAFVEYEDHQLMLFVEKEDGSYSSTRTGSFMVKNYIDDLSEKMKKLEESLRKRVINGELSPIYYYMTLSELSPAEVSSRMGLSVRKIKKHMTTDFQSIRMGEAKKYADLFGISLADLFQLYTPESAKMCRQNPTNNEYVTVLDISGGKL